MAIHTYNTNPFKTSFSFRENVRDSKKPLLNAEAFVHYQMQDTAAGGNIDRFIKDNLARSLSEEIVRTATFGIRVEQDLRNHGTRYKMSVAVLSPHEYETLRRKAEASEKVQKELEKVKAELRYAREQANLNRDEANRFRALADKYSTIKQALQD